MLNYLGQCILVHLNGNHAQSFQQELISTSSFHKQWISTCFWRFFFFFEVLDPATGQPWASLASATTTDVEKAVEAADAVFHGGSWYHMTARKRACLLLVWDSLIRTKQIWLGSVAGVRNWKTVQGGRGRDWLSANVLLVDGWRSWASARICS